MSFLNTPEVTPSRVLGLYRRLLAEGKPVSPDVLGAMVWPRETRSSDAGQPAFDQINLLEMREALLIEKTDDGCVRPHPDLPAEVRGSDIDSATADLPRVLGDLIFHGGERNHDLAYALAWYLMQDPLQTPTGKDDLPNAAKDQGVGELTGLINDTRYGTFRDWSCYLGLAWLHDSGKGSELQVDPTVHIRMRLPDVLPEVGLPEPVGAVMERLAARSPVFDGGVFSSTVAKRVGRRDSKEKLSQSTSFGLLRLKQEGLVSFSALSDDTSPRILSCGEVTERLTHLTRLK